jgi:hypothetical protein
VRRSMVLWAALLSYALVGCTGALEHTSAPSGLARAASSAAQVDASYPHCVENPDLKMVPLPAGTRLRRTAQQARDAAQVVGPRNDVRVYPALVTDPTAPKVGLPVGPRPMWVVDGHNVVQPQTNGPPTVYKAGTVLRQVTLVDDATLGLGGNFACGVVSVP